MGLLLASWTMGLILALLALGVYVSFRVLRFSDITVDGSLTLGGAVSVVLLTAQVSPLLATPVAVLAGMLAGMVTGILHTKFKINQLLSGILVMTALYSINLRVMGKSNVALQGAPSLVGYVRNWTASLAGDADARTRLGSWEVAVADLLVLAGVLIFVAVIGVGLFAFFRTDLGTALRATGDNDQMCRALGVDVDRMMIAGLALANGLAALAGSLMAQQQGFADVQMGIGMVVWGLASVIMGEALVGGQHHLGLALVGAVMGSLLFRLLQALVLRAGLNPNDMKLITAVFLFAALVAPALLAGLKSRQTGAKHA
ncbi:MAG: ABC transporter permease [Planctomycetia bacterium]|nr:ABC transporter permease [Planctomycetia bacterium]